MTGAPTPLLTPAETVERSGFSLDTLRYYERIGLLAGVGRAASGHRRFTEGDLQWLGVLRCLRDTGMPIADMRRYAELARSDDPSSVQERLDLLERHQGAVRERIALLQAQEGHLAEKIGHYRTLLEP
ncbi:MerR family transcriptional regulator [Streptomyces sp. NRRL B-24484]|uniref:MerR family transcriptional regulator n=1 Tax=Streptomyces sp. NRRL B-24484 TaxID=1463833 RepID=UPI0004BF1DF6|nr:MerR family transcriptional regulator [Streptomyces sp. NRRL B-24484]